MAEKEPPRDDTLGAALRELPVPEHNPEFDARLRARLETDGVGGTVVRLPRVRGRRLPGLPLAAAGPAAAVAVVVAINLAGRTEVASAAEVRAAVARAFSSADVLRGVLVYREREGERLGENRWSFVVTAEGDYRVTSARFRTTLAYSAERNVEHYSDGPNFAVRTGIAPGWPDSGAGDYIVMRSLASVVHALRAGGDADVEETQFRGRPAWMLRTRTHNEDEQREITIDRESGFPVRDRLFFRGRLSSEWRIDALRTGGRVAPGAFRLARRPRQTVSRYDAGFSRVALAEAGETVGYAPLVPAWVPSGFRLAGVAVANRSRRTGNEQRQNPWSREVVSLAYRRGFDKLVVTTRLIGPDRSRWSDPVTIGDLSREPERFTVESGVLRGARAELVVDPNSVPHVWALTDRLVVTIAGDVRADELRRIANSLAERPQGSR